MVRNMVNRTSVTKTTLLKVANTAREFFIPLHHTFTTPGSHMRWCTILCSYGRRLIGICTFLITNVKYKCLYFKSVIINLK